VRTFRHVTPAAAPPAVSIFVANASGTSVTALPPVQRSAVSAIGT